MSSLIRRMQKKRDGKAKREQEQHDMAMEAARVRQAAVAREQREWRDLTRHA